MRGEVWQTGWAFQEAPMTRHPRICVLGGCGMMGRVIVMCLLRQDRTTRVTVVDRQVSPAPLPPRVRFRRVNLLDHRALVRALRGHAVVINSTSHHFNLPVMRAALDARVHYLDLGGLFHFTRRQLKLDATFRRRGLTAILGMGCAPGVANLLARWAAEGMERVEEIHIKVGDRSWDPPSSAAPYAIGTIREELTWKPAIYRRGRWRFERPFSGVEWFRFAAPVGRQKIFRTIHSEVATLPKSFPGVRECSFKIGFPDEMIRAVLHPPRKSRHRASNISAPARPRPGGEYRALPPPHDAEVTAAVVGGFRGGKRMTRVASYIARSSGGHSAGDWNTAWPPAVAAGMIARGELRQPGVSPPERTVPLRPFFARLREAGLSFSLRDRSVR